MVAGENRTGRLGGEAAAGRLASGRAGRALPGACLLLAWRPHPLHLHPPPQHQRCLHRCLPITMALNVLASTVATRQSQCAFEERKKNKLQQDITPSYLYGGDSSVFIVPFSHPLRLSSACDGALSWDWLLRLLRLLEADVLQAQSTRSAAAAAAGLIFS